MACRALKRSPRGAGRRRASCPGPRTSAVIPVAAQRLSHWRSVTHHHHAPPVGAEEVLRIGPVERIAQLWPIVAVDGNFADDAEMAQHGKGHILQRQFDKLSLAGALAVALGGQDCRARPAGRRCSPRPAAHVPRVRSILRAVAVGNPTDGLTCVVHLRAAVPSRPSPDIMIRSSRCLRSSS